MNAPQSIEINPDLHQPDPVRSVHIDYLTLSIPNQYRGEVEQWCRERFGQFEPGKGARFLSQSLRYAQNAAAIFYDPESHPKRKPSFILDIPGAGCQLAKDEALIELAIEARRNWGAHLTRLDIAVDMIGGVEELIAQVHESCKRGESCRFRRFKHTEDVSGTLLAGKTIDLGKRGKDGSGRSVCLYDKGLETKQLPAGQWVRWEARYSDVCADQALEVYAIASDVDRALLAFDAVEFRQVVPGETHVDRRPFCEWWVKLRQSICQPNMIRRFRRASSAAGMIHWFGKQVIPTFEQIRRELNVTWDDLVSVMAKPDQLPTRQLAAHAQQLCKELADGTVDDDGVIHPSIYEILWNTTIKGVRT